MTTAKSDTVYQAFTAAANQWPERDMLNVLPTTAKIYGIAAEALSYRQMHEQVISFSMQFEKAGYSEGMRVALLLENRPVFFMLWLALNRIGVSVVPINPDLRARELSYLLGHSEPALIIAIATHVSELQEAVIDAQIIANVIEINDELPTPRANAIVTRRLFGGERECAVLYTSGTTGNPKGCVLPNNYFLLAGLWYATVGGLATLSTDGERMITPLPLFHMNAMAYSFMAMITVGGCLTVLDRFHPRSWWDDVRESKATCLHYLGVMPSLLMDADASPNDQQHTIKFGFGAGVDPKLHAAFENRFGFVLVEAWAMTETGAGAVVAASGSTNDTGDETGNGIANDTTRLVGKSCLGRPAATVECKLIDDNGVTVEPNQPGELLVRRSGSNPRYGFFSEYYKDEAATIDAWQDGWFHTGDIVRQDEHFNLFFVDRKKNVIRRSGENIAAVEVESILMQHPQVTAAGVTAVPDTIRGDEVFACLQVNNPSNELAIEITQWCLTQLAYYKAPGYIAFVTSLPLTATQKVQRAALKQLALELVDDPATINTVKLKKRQTVGHFVGQNVK